MKITCHIINFQECDKKEAECIKSAGSIRNEFEVSCRQLGIQSNGDIKRQLAGLVSELPDILDKTAQLIKETVAAQRHYAVFSNFVLGKAANATWTPMLAYVAGKASTWLY